MLSDAVSNPTTLIDIIQSAGVIGLLVVVVYGAIKEWWVPGKTHKRCLDERDQLLNLALRQANAAEKAVSLAEKERRK